MGCFQSDENKQKDRQLNRELNQQRRADNAIKKLLFLGSGGSGKSTLFKQLRSLHGSGFGEKDRLQFRDHIYAQIREQMRLALEAIDIANEEEDEKGYQLSAKGQEARDKLDSWPSQSGLNDAICEVIKVLWAEKAVKDVYENRKVTKIEDSTAYFWDEVDRIVASDFVPNDKDILLVRYRTTGVIEQKFEMKKNMFHVFDVGGQKSERRKWINCFEHVTAVIFVASLSCYDEVMFEDEEKNSMSDSIELFGTICNNEYFKETAMILFLNKKDLFAEKIKNVAITECPEFAHYNGPQASYDSTTAFIKKIFEGQSEHDKSIFTHLTCAVERNQVEKVFNDIQTVIINASLAQGGLIA